MPRNQNGSYSLPEPPVKPGDTVRSDWANNTTGDIGKALTDSLDRDGVGGMKGPLKLADGSTTSPALTFTNDNSAGLIRIRAGVLGLVFDGEIMCELSANGVTYLENGRVFLANDPVLPTEASNKRYVDSRVLGILSEIPDGTEAAPGLTFNAEKDSGLYRAGSRDLGLSIGTKRLVRYQANVMTVDGQVNATGFKGDGSQLTNLALPVTAPTFPAGTVMLFAQTTAPTGWTKLSTHDNKALRVVSGTAGSGGSVNFTTAFTARTVDATVLTQAQMPAHTHSFTASTASAGSHVHGVSDPGHSHSIHGGGFWTRAGNVAGNSPIGGTAAVVERTDGSGTGIAINAGGAHTHSLSGSTNNTGSGSSHNHTLNMAVQYVDVIMARKS